MTGASPSVAPNDRLQRTVRACASTVLRGVDEEAALGETCRLLVEETGYHMAWVARSQNGSEAPDGPRWRPVAHCGVPLDFRQPGADDAHKDPVLRALRAGRPFVARNLPRGGPAHLQNHGKRHGYGSLAVVPLRLFRDAPGALVVCAAEPEAFGPVEMELLLELTAYLDHAFATREEEAQRELEERLLQAGRKRYEEFFQSAREGAFAASRHGTIRLVNPAFARMLGYAGPEQMLASSKVSLYTIMKPSDKNALLAAATGNGPGRLDLELWGRAGNTVAVTAHVARTEAPDGEEIIVLVSPRADDGHRAASRMIDSLLDAPATAIVRVDRQGVVRSWNEAAHALYGFSPEEAIGRRVWEVHMDGGMEEQEEAVMAAMRDGGGVRAFVTRRKRKDGTFVEASVDVVAIPGRRRQLLGYWTIERPVPPRRDKERDDGSAGSDGHGPAALTQEAVQTTPEEGHVGRPARLVKARAASADRTRPATHGDGDPDPAAPLARVLDPALRHARDLASRRRIRVLADPCPERSVRASRSAGRALRRALDHLIHKTAAGGAVRIRALESRETVQLQVKSRRGDDDHPPGDDDAWDARAWRDLGGVQELLERSGGRLRAVEAKNGDGPALTITLPVAEAAVSKRTGRTGRPRRTTNPDV